MLGNDISNYNTVGQGVIFENLLASPPKVRRFFKFNGDWDKEIKRWVPHELPLKALIDTSDRLGVDTEVYTLLPSEAVEPIESWLIRKGISLPVFAYETIQDLEYDLRFKRSIRTVFVSDPEHAKVLGIRATVVDNQKAWTL